MKKTIKARKALKKVVKKAKTKVKAVDQEWVEAERSTLVAPTPVMPPAAEYFGSYEEEAAAASMAKMEIPMFAYILAGLLLGGVVVYFFIF